MKIGIDVSQSVYSGTGVAAYTTQLVTALLNQARHEYVLFGSAWGRQPELANFFKNLPKHATMTQKMYSLPPWVLAFLWNKLHTPTIERFTGPVDVFHTSDWTEPPARVPKVTTIHDLVLYKYPGMLSEEIVANHKARLFWVKKEAAAIIADSQSTKNDIVRFLAIDPQKIHVVYLGIGSEFFPQKIDRVIAVKKKYGIKGAYMLCIGTREPRKNLVRTINAFKKINQSDVELVVGGNFGWGEDVGRSTGVQIVGFVAPLDLPALYTGSSGFLYPSLYEGFGLPVLEALACGVPVITSGRGSLGEIADGVAVEVNPEEPADIQRGIETILRLTHHQRKKLVEKGLQHARQFTWERTAAQTLEVYQQVVNQ